MAGTPRKAAVAGVDGNGAVKGIPNQGERPTRQPVNPSGMGEKDYVRKPTNLSPTNLPHRKTDDGSAPSA